jgi:hypothetical protein
MATVTNGSAGPGRSVVADPLAVGGWRGGDESDSKSDRYLAKRLAAAGADYKGVALTTFLLGVGVAVLVWLAVGIILEHWVVPGGLSRPVRWAWLVTGLAALVAAIIRWVVPLVRYRVNLVYAARAIEREHPELHNDLVNTVLVKAHPEASPPMVVRSLERRTAKRLSDLPAEGVIDRTPALRLACVLAALVGIACLYEVFAPKSFVVSAARLLAPWATWAAPSRVAISPVELAWRMPGEQAGRGQEEGGGGDRRRLVVESGAATLVRGRQLVVSADIRGLRRDEQPNVTVAPLAAGGAGDRALASWQAEMDRGEAVAGLRSPAESSRVKRFAVVLPDSARGLDEPVEIVISAGDARSEPVRIAVVDSPSLLVREVRYDYPPYTRRQAETVEWQGDIRAVEATQVTVIAESNQPLDAAWIDFDCDGDHDLPFNKKANDLARVTKSFPLQMNAERSGPAHAFYRLMFRPRAATGSAREPEVVEPMEHRIEVIPDLAPEVSIEEPRESPARVPPGAPVAVRVRALDPDFALARVGIETRLRGGPIQPGITLLAEEKAGLFKGSARIVPERLGAGPGSVLEYRAVAIDTRPQTPNISYTGWQSLEIDASAPARPPEDPAPRSAGDRGERSDDQGERSGDDGADSADAGESQGKGEPEGEEPSPERQGQQEEQQQPSEQKKQDQEKQDQEQQHQQNQNGQQSKPQQGDKSGAAEGGQKGGNQETPGQSQRGDKQGAGGNQGQGAEQGQGVGAQGERQGGQKSGSQKSQDGGGDKAGDNKSGAEQQNGQNQNGQEQGGKEQGGKQQGGGQQNGKEQDGKSDAGKEQGATQAGGKPKPNPAVASDGTNDGEAMERILDHRRQQGGDKKPNGDKQSGQNQQAGKPGGEKPAGESDTGKQQPGGEKQQPGGDKQAAEQQGDKKNEGASQCDKADGKPCGKDGCSTCSGGGKAGDGAGKPGAGKEGQGKEGAGEQGEGQQPGSGQRGSGQQQSTGEKSGDGREGQSQQGGGEGEKQGAEKGAEKHGGQQAAGDKQDSGEQGGDGKGGEQQGGEAAGKQPGGNEQSGAPQPGGEQPGGQQAGNEQAGNADQSGKAAREGGQGPKEGEAPAPAQSGKPGSGSGAAGSGGWAGGEGPHEPGKPQAEGAAPSKKTEWGEGDLRSAKNAADLAIEHLRSAVESGSSDVLDRLGWTREQARAFLERWETMRRMAESDDPVQRGEFERAVRSLGLRPDGVRSSRDVPSDVRGGQSEGRRSRPPSEYREQFKAYTQGTAGE